MSNLDSALALTKIAFNSANLCGYLSEFNDSTLFDATERGDLLYGDLVSQIDYSYRLFDNGEKLSIDYRFDLDAKEVQYGLSYMVRNEVDSWEFDYVPGREKVLYERALMRLREYAAEDFKRYCSEKLVNNTISAVIACLAGDLSDFGFTTKTKTLTYFLFDSVRVNTEIPTFIEWESSNFSSNEISDFVTKALAPHLVALAA
jgi:hypothetical protein